ncbi:DUF1501 domain-containing protein [Allomesorhizobium alhagi]|uniref:DUF1501 domain-containing protein n=1 Tax=Mesorhizobium alhagi CCNWXJ12-2 TaxID=1107882 RepID=H0I082_9HYPH|nr:DUF1501 domain-containing protein [Mesorhizobium alhagi]EHK53628.1 hypothetical protein MAXJ12_29345 [Mesorhizobium alhagi CCNWXJ12-2]
MQLTRRAALQGLILAPVFGSVPLARAAESIAPGNEPRLLVVHLRGGLDALAALPPHGDPNFASARGPLAPFDSADVAAALKLDGLFALHPALGALLPYYQSGELLIVPATAVPDADRSHAAAQVALFDGDIDSGSAGWLDRASSVLSSRQHAVWRAAPADRSMDMLADLVLANPRLDIARLCAEGACLAGGDDRDDLLGQRGVADAARIAEAAGNGALVLSAAGGPRIAMLELAGFDTHVAQGAQAGRLARALDALARGLVTFAKASGPAWKRTAVLVVTEFGRSVALNADGGTEHGTASVTFLMGGAVAGGRIGNRWPGLAPDRLQGGTDLAATTDARSIIRAILTEHLRLPDRALAKIFPSAAGIPAMPGLFRANPTHTESV